jgi:hypothetical protein
VNCFSMFPEISILAKRALTGLAEVWLLPRMLFEVVLDVADLVEQLIAVVN